MVDLDEVLIFELSSSKPGGGPSPVTSLTHRQFCQAVTHMKGEVKVTCIVGGTESHVPIGVVFDLRKCGISLNSVNSQTTVYRIRSLVVHDGRDYPHHEAIPRPNAQQFIPAGPPAVQADGSNQSNQSNHR